MGDSALLDSALLGVVDELGLGDMQVELVLLGFLQGELLAFELQWLLQAELLL